VAAATRVLLITPDHRFRVVASAFLAQHGCSVISAERITDAARWARRVAADVVILDASTSLTAAVREAARVHALEPSVGIVMVAEGAAYELTAMLVLAKWDSFDGLYSAIEAELARLRRNSA
jgi:DNA-binding NtrC family response regulator